jgi:hypothetical protein
MTLQLFTVRETNTKTGEVAYPILSVTKTEHLINEYQHKFCFSKNPFGTIWVTSDKSKVDELVQEPIGVIEWGNKQTMFLPNEDCIYEVATLKDSLI